MTRKCLKVAGAIWLLWFVAASGEPGALGQIKDPLADVTIYPIGEDGLGVLSFRVERFTSRNGEDYRARFRGLRGTGIPEGTYDFVLKSPDSGGGINITGHAAVFEPSSLVVVPVSRSELTRLSADRIQPREFEIRGTLAHVPVDSPPSEPLRVRLVSVYGTGQFDLSVDPSGDFRIHNALEGRYLLLVIRGSTVLALQQISFDENDRSADFVVDLSQHPAPVIHVLPSPH